MSDALDRLCVFLANLVWLLYCIPGWLAFLIASRHVKKTQSSLLARILKREVMTGFGRRHGFESITTPDEYQAVPPTEYEDYSHDIQAIKAGRRHGLTHDRVELLQPTSGSMTSTKLIPYTLALKKAFKAAIDPWVASLYMAFPTLLLGRHYWSISPSTPYKGDSLSKVRIGFADDTEYLGRIERMMSRMLFTVPDAIVRVKDPVAFEYLTLLFLCRERNLRLISIWHPSFLTILIRALPGHLPSIRHDIETGSIKEDLYLVPELRAEFTKSLRPQPGRAHELSNINIDTRDWPQAIWPRLRLISCWTDGVSEPWVSTLATLFPRSFIQSKGLTATEGIVTFPLGRTCKKVCAIRSHYLEFLDVLTEKIHPAWEVEPGREYSIVITTGGGLYRYRLHDIVLVTGFYNQTPCLDFISRDNLVSDLVGEKLNAHHVESVIDKIEKTIGQQFEFAMLAPHKVADQVGYVLFVQPSGNPEPDWHQVACMTDELLRHNYHYHHARNLSQLMPIRVFCIEQDAALTYRRHLTGRDIKVGDIKFQRLSMDSFCPDEFDGEFF